MARHKSSKKKGHLITAKRKNKRTPIWVVMRTQDRSRIAKPTRKWRETKIGGKIKKAMKRVNYKEKVMATGTKIKKRRNKRR